MLRFVRTITALGILGLAGPQGLAQDPAGWIEELRELRKTVDHQSKQIDLLSQQVARLTAALEGKPVPPSPTPAPAAPEAGAAQTTQEFSPTAKPDPGQPRHVVIKGDTLTSIAKQYNVTLADLLKANRDVNERKLQIGQSINLPPNAQIKSPSSAPEPKPNP
jgi:LysM repeat protein